MNQQVNPLVPAVDRFTHLLHFENADEDIGALCRHNEDKRPNRYKFPKHQENFKESKKWVNDTFRSARKRAQVDKLNIQLVNLKRQKIAVDQKIAEKSRLDVRKKGKITRSQTAVPFRLQNKKDQVVAKLEEITKNLEEAKTQVDAEDTQLLYESLLTVKNSITHIQYNSETKVWKVLIEKSQLRTSDIKTDLAVEVSERFVEENFLDGFISYMKEDGAIEGFSKCVPIDTDRDLTIENTPEFPRANI